MWKVNLNDCIKVKLNDFGKDIYYRQYAEINEKIRCLGGKPIESTMPKVDEEGYTKFQMWQFMNIYGEYMIMGSTPVLETLDIIICDGEPVKEGEEE